MYYTVYTYTQLHIDIYRCVYCIAEIALTTVQMLIPNDTNISWYLSPFGGLFARSDPSAERWIHHRAVRSTS